ncbi:sugar transporter [Kozakia baliensis NRIC 0488]|nr:sugar transporter [Kozakia baliensis NRIC 0488]GEL64994.1 hypothetical protein KBA01_22800 [Kozakia baliensis]
MAHELSFAGSPERPVIRSADDISAIVNRGPAGKGHANVIVLLALGGVFLDAYDLTTLSYGIGDVQKHFGLTTTQTGFVAAAMNAGTVAGSIFGGWLTDRIGRYAVFMADMACFVIAALVAGFAPTATILIAARFAMGFGVGMDLPVAMAFLSEFSKLSGKGSKASRAAAWCPTWYAASSLCFLLVFALNAVIPAGHPDWLWRASLAFGALPALTIILVRSRYMSESPIWIARNGDLRRAAEILRASHGVDPVLHVTMPPPRPNPPPPSSLLRPPLLRRTVLVCGMKIVSAYSYAAIAFGAPTLLSTMLHATRTQVLVISNHTQSRLCLHRRPNRCAYRPQLRLPTDYDRGLRATDCRHCYVGIGRHATFHRRDRFRHHRLRRVFVRSGLRPRLPADDLPDAELSDRVAG